MAFESSFFQIFCTSSLILAILKAKIATFWYLLHYDVIKTLNLFSEYSHERGWGDMFYFRRGKKWEKKNEATTLSGGQKQKANAMHSFKMMGLSKVVQKNSSDIPGWFLRHGTAGILYCTYVLQYTKFYKVLS